MWFKRKEKWPKVLFVSRSIAETNKVLLEDKLKGAGFNLNGEAKIEVNEHIVKYEQRLREGD